MATEIQLDARCTAADQMNVRMTKPLAHSRQAFGLTYHSDKEILNITLLPFIEKSGGIDHGLQDIARRESNAAQQRLCETAMQG